MEHPIFKVMAASTLTLVLAACGGGGSSSNNNLQPGDNTEGNDAASGGVQYSMTFDQTWSGATFPTNHPSSAHFSPLVGATHNSQVVIWRPQDQPSTAGLEIVAESGSTSTFTMELEEHRSSGYVDEIFRHGGPEDSPGSQQVTFTATEQFPLVSAVSMIAPSPDWFVGVRDVNLYPNGEWVDRLEFDLRLYDSGTDLAERFTASNNDGGDRIITLVSTDAIDTDFANGVHRRSGAFVGRIIIERQ